MRDRNLLLVRLLAGTALLVPSLALAACGGDEGGGSGEPTDAANAAYAALADGDWEEICSSSTEGAQQQYVLLAQSQTGENLDCPDAAEAYLGLTGAEREMAESAEAGTVSATGENAGVTIEFDGGPSGSVSLEQADGKWLLAGVLSKPPQRQVDLSKDKSSLYLRANKEVVKTVEGFFEGLAARDPARVCRAVAYSDEAAEQGPCEDRYAALIKEMRKDGSLKNAAKAEVTDAGIDDDIASAAVLFGSTPVPVQLARSGDEWKVTSFVRPVPTETTTTPSPAQAP